MSRLLTCWTRAALLQQYERTLADGAGFLFPVAGLRCLTRLRNLSAGHRLAVVCGDKAHRRSLSFMTPSPPHVAVHGRWVTARVDASAVGGCSLTPPSPCGSWVLRRSVSVVANLHAIALWCGLVSRWRRWEGGTTPRSGAYVADDTGSGGRGGRDDFGYDTDESLDPVWRAPGTGADHGTAEAGDDVPLLLASPQRCATLDVAVVSANMPRRRHNATAAAFAASAATFGVHDFFVLRDHIEDAATAAQGRGKGSDLLSSVGDSGAPALSDTTMHAFVRLGGFDADLVWQFRASLLRPHVGRTSVDAAAKALVLIRVFDNCDAALQAYVVAGVAIAACFAC